MQQGEFFQLNVVKSQTSRVKLANITCHVGHFNVLCLRTRCRVFHLIAEHKTPNLLNMNTQAHDIRENLHRFTIHSLFLCPCIYHPSSRMLIIINIY